MVKKQYAEHPKTKISVTSSERHFVENFWIRMHADLKYFDKTFFSTCFIRHYRLNIWLRMVSVLLFLHRYLYFLCLDCLSYRVKEVMLRYSMYIKSYLPQASHIWNTYCTLRYSRTIFSHQPVMNLPSSTFIVKRYLNSHLLQLQIEAFRLPLHK